MNNICKNLAMCIVSAVCALSPAWADDATAVVERTDCAATNAEISELAAITSPSEEETTRLAELQTLYRRDCVTRSVRSRSSGRTSSPTPVAETDTIDVADATETPAAEEVVETPQLTAEEIAANINAGLCADGTKPNRFGCCAGEKFKDLGNLVFACCREDGECFPPIE